MIPHLVPEIEGGYPERDGEGGEGLVLEYSRSWMIMLMIIMIISGVAPSLVCVWLEGDGAVDEYDLH